METALFLALGLTALIGGAAFLVFLVTMPFVRFWHAVLFSFVTSIAGWISFALATLSILNFIRHFEQLATVEAIGSVVSLLALFVTGRTIWRRGRRSHKPPVAVDDFS
ncbi:MAG TPA: hypothetical protein VMI56_12310 [Reyranella sp.]|nr:hypothetical protein [Reyranella sp.]